MSNSPTNGRACPSPLVVFLGLQSDQSLELSPLRFLTPGRGRKGSLLELGMLQPKWERALHVNERRVVPQLLFQPKKKGFGNADLSLLATRCGLKGLEVGCQQREGMGWMAGALPGGRCWGGTGGAPAVGNEDEIPTSSRNNGAVFRLASEMRGEDRDKKNQVKAFCC